MLYVDVCKDVIDEYCERDIFDAECTAPDEVVLITAALYGRMRHGRCVSKKPIGCHVDVQQLLAVQCSARRRCRVSVASLVPDNSQPCPADYRSYLEASYTCIKGNSHSYVTPDFSGKSTALKHYMRRSSVNKPHSQCSLLRHAICYRFQIL